VKTVGFEGIAEIVYLDPKRRDIVICDHPECVSWIFTTRQSLFLCATDVRPIRLLLPQSKADLQTYGAPVTQRNAGPMRYITLCHHTGVRPCESFVNFFGAAQGERHTHIQIDGNFQLRRT
jgi:hypothetical protein